jgi:hypothetical protein
MFKAKREALPKATDFNPEASGIGPIPVKRICDEEAPELTRAF